MPISQLMAHAAKRSYTSLGDAFDQAMRLTPSNAPVTLNKKREREGRRNALRPTYIQRPVDAPQETRAADGDQGDEQVSHKPVHVPLDQTRDWPDKKKSFRRLVRSDPRQQDQRRPQQRVQIQAEGAVPHV